MRIIFTAIFGEYEELKEPQVVTPGWRYLCFTDQPFKSSVWEIVTVNRSTISDRLLARECKIQFHKYIGAEESIWIDGAFTINCDLNEWWAKYGPVAPAVMTCIKHPMRDCVFEEAAMCIKNNRDNVHKIADQAKEYRKYVPPHNGLIQSGILMRRRYLVLDENDKIYEPILRICERWFQETSRHSLRDQISFCRIIMEFPKDLVRYITWDYRSGQEFIFKTHYKHRR